MARVLAATIVRQHCNGKRGQAERVIQFALGEQPRVGRYAGTVKFQLETAVENEPRSAQIRVTRRVRDDYPQFNDISL